MAMVLMPQKFFIHLLGKTGTGKSSTGNTILTKKIFSCKASTSAVTKEIQMATGRLGRREVEVVDGPGLVDINTGVSPFSIQAFRKVIEDNKDCVHLFLLIWRYGDPFSTDDVAMVEAMRKEFGSKVFRDHGIIVMTCGDNFRTDTEDEDITFESWCKDQRGTFADLLKQCQGRVLLIENTRPISKGDPEALFALEKLMVNEINLDAATGMSLEKKEDDFAIKADKVKEVLLRFKIPLFCLAMFCAWKLVFSSFF